MILRSNSDTVENRQKTESSVLDMCKEKMGCYVYISYNSSESVGIIQKSSTLKNFIEKSFLPVFSEKWENAFKSNAELYMCHEYTPSDSHPSLLRSALRRLKVTLNLVFKHLVITHV